MAATTAWCRSTGPVRAHTALLALGYGVEWHDYPMEHSVCMEELADLQRWLLRVLA